MQLCIAQIIKFYDIHNRMEGNIWLHLEEFYDAGIPYFPKFLIRKNQEKNQKWLEFHYTVKSLQDMMTFIFFFKILPG